PRGDRAAPGRARALVGRAPVTARTTARGRAAFARTEHSMSGTRPAGSLATAREAITCPSRNPPPRESNAPACASADSWALVTDLRLPPSPVAGTITRVETSAIDS